MLQGVFRIIVALFRFPMLQVLLEICDRSCPVHKDATCNHLVWIQIQPQSEGRQTEGFVPIFVPCFLGYPDLFRFAPIFAPIFPICSQHTSEQIRENPLLPSLWQVPNSVSHLQFPFLSRVCSAIAKFVSMARGLRVMRVRAHKTLMSPFRIGACG